MSFYFVIVLVINYWIAYYPQSFWIKIIIALLYVIILWVMKLSRAQMDNSAPHSKSWIHSWYSAGAWCGLEGQRKINPRVWCLDGTNWTVRLNRNPLLLSDFGTSMCILSRVLRLQKASQGYKKWAFQKAQGDWKILMT